MRHFFWILFFSAFAIQAQTIEVSDLQTGKGIPNVYVYCDDASGITDTIGSINLKPYLECEKIYLQHPSYLFSSYSLKELKKVNYKISLEQEVTNLGEVQVSYNKWETNRKEIPIEIAKIDIKDIQFQNPQTAAELLGQSGEVFIQKSQLGGGSPMIRGFSTSRVLLVVDGVRMNTAIFREGNVQNVISLDANTIEQAEVVFGPGSVIYGSDAIGGVMDFHTLKPVYGSKEKTNFRLSYLTRYSSANNERTGHAHFNYGTQNLAVLSSITFSAFGDQIMGSNGPNDYLRPTYQSVINGVDTGLANANSRRQIETGYSQINLMQKIRYRVDKRTDIVYGYHYSNTNNIPRYDRLIATSSSGGLQFAEWYYGPQKWVMNNIAITNKWKNPVYDQLKITAAVQQFEESRNDRRFGSADKETTIENLDAYSVSVDFEKQLQSNMSLYYGVEGVLNLLDSEGYSTNIFTRRRVPIQSRYADGSSWMYTSAYSNLKYDINPELTLNTGLRANYIRLRGTLSNEFFDFPFDNINNDFFALNGSVGLAWVPTKSWQINLNFSNGFKAPNIDDASKVFDSGDGIVVVPSAELKPEMLYTADLGLIKNVGENLQLELSGYYSVLRNALIRQPFQFNGQDSILFEGELSQVNAIQNVEQATVYGWQAAVKYDFDKSWSFKSSFHYNFGETTSGEALRHVAPMFGTGHIIWTQGKYQADLYGIFNNEISFNRLAPSEREKTDIYALDENGNPYSPAWATLNLKVDYNLRPYLKIQLGIENILDARYQPYSSGIAAAGRNFTIALRGNL